jgi:hypothetical protein
MKMNQYQRAAQIWSILALTAKYQKVISYKIIKQLTGLPQEGLGMYLDRIDEYCIQNGLPDLWLLVVNESTGLPTVSKKKDAQDILRRQHRAFVYDWLSKSPQADDFMKAHEKTKG